MSWSKRLERRRYYGESVEPVDTEEPVVDMDGVATGLGVGPYCIETKTASDILASSHTAMFSPGEYFWDHRVSQTLIASNYSGNTDAHRGIPGPVLRSRVPSLAPNSS